MVFSLEKCSVPTTILGMIFESGTDITRERKNSTCENGEIFLFFKTFYLTVNGTKRWKLEIWSPIKDYLGEKSVFFLSIPPPGLHCRGRDVLIILVDQDEHFAT